MKLGQILIFVSVKSSWLVGLIRYISKMKSYEIKLSDNKVSEGVRESQVAINMAIALQTTQISLQEILVLQAVQNSGLIW